MPEQHVPLHLEETDVAELLRASLRPLAEQAARSRIDLHIATLGDVPLLLVDREKLAWSVTALVGNALRYVAHGETSGDVGGSVLVHVTHESGSDTASISIQDDGPGIPGDKLPFLFERRRGAVHADGLALSLVRQIVAAHDGRIDVESRREPDDHGTCITIALPVPR
ncbi:MAG: HAMP domain-containing histidine kinase [Labilithrix sp.]|nr:HAMP domain-containing histidine kinase [Labilithrix sp.]MBX3221144.1 HAMP domain-containing histidine kinase [Labilithrix sp.]